MSDTSSIPTSFLQSLRRRWMDAAQPNIMASRHHQQTCSPVTPLSDAELLRATGQRQQEDLGPGAKLPVECIELIVGHIENISTLWSLLTVNKRVAAVVLRRLYTNPYRSILMGFLFHEGIPIRRLAQRILTLTHLSPEGPYIASMKRVLEIQNAPLPRLEPENSTWIDYLTLVRELEWPNDIWEELHEFFHEVGTEMVKDARLRSEVASMVDNNHDADPRWSCPPVLAQSTLTWAICGGSAEQLGRIRKIWIPIHDIERFLDPGIVAQLTQLDEVVFDGRYASINTDFEATFQNGISFVRAHRNYHLSQGGAGRIQGTSSGSSNSSSSGGGGGGGGGGARLDSARFERLSWRGYEHLERELYSLLPPLNKPKHLTKVNWDRFMIKPHETDTSRVESIFYEEPDKVDWDPYLPGIPSFLLPSCRRLVRLRLRVRVREAASIFQWAVEEKKRRGTDNDGAARKDDGLVRLEELDLTCDRGTMQQVIQDTMFAFGHSLRVVNVMPTMDAAGDSDSDQAFLDDFFSEPTNNNSTDEFDGLMWNQGQQNSYPSSGPTSKLCIGAGWNLPRLVRLCIVSNPPIELDPKALAHCRRLELVRLRDDAVMPITVDHNIQPLNLPAYDEWILPNATRIKLIGNAATKFNPTSLAWMRRLTWLELSQRMIVDFASANVHDSSSTSSSPPTTSTTLSADPPASVSASSLPLPQTNPWTWDWDLPVLQTLILVGDSALLFELKILQRAPKLRALSLDIQRVQKEFSWTIHSNIEAPQLEELCLLGNWSISNETLQFILLGSAGTGLPSAKATQSGSPSSAEGSTTQSATCASAVGTPCPALSHMQLIHCHDYSLQVLVQACEQRRPRRLRNVRCSQSLSDPDARKMGLELVDQSHLMYSNPYLQDVISYHTWVTYHNRSQGLLSMLSSPTSQQQPIVCVYTLNDVNYRHRKWPWTS